MELISGPSNEYSKKQAWAAEDDSCCNAKWPNVNVAAIRCLPEQAIQKVGCDKNGSN